MPQQDGEHPGRTRGNIAYRTWLLVGEAKILLREPSDAHIERFLDDQRSLPFSYGASWLWPYLVGLAVISYLGTFGDGAGVIPFGLDVLVVSVFSIGIYVLAMSVRLTPEEVRRHVAEAKEEAEEVDEELAVWRHG